MYMSFRVISLFSGCGGMDLGFKQAGFDIVWANDFYKEAINTYKLNLGDHIVYGDITKIPSTDLPNNIDVVIGGFPCQGFSVNNINRSMEDSRNFLYRELLRIIKDKKPKFFVAENVKGLLSMEHGKVIDMIIQDFTDLGYKVDYRVLCASQYGVPQNRQRVIIIGNRIGVENPYPTIEYKTEAEAPTVKDTIGDLADIPVSSEPIVVDGKTIYNHNARTNVSDTYFARKYDVDTKEVCAYLKDSKKKAKLSIRRIAEQMQLPETQVAHWFRTDKYGSIPTKDEYLQLKALLNLDGKYEKELTTYIEKPIIFDQALRVTNWDRPSDTITASGPEIHVNRKRRLSVREVARLQSFPDDFVFTGGLDMQYKQVGNAVPPLLAKKIASGIAKKLEM